MNTRNISDNQIDLLTLYDDFLLRLHAFVNGETLNIPSRALYPFLKFNINNFNKMLAIESDKALIEVISSLEEFENCDFSRTKSILRKYFKNGKCLYSLEISSYDYANVLSTLYEELKSNLSHKKKKKQTSISLLNSYEDWTNKLSLSKAKNKFSPLLELHSKLSRKKYLFKHLILQGSCSTLDVTNFSDIDFLIILKDDVVSNPRKLIESRDLVLKSRKYLDLFNRYNHHSFMIATELDLSFYRESFLPISTFKNSTSFLGDKKLFICRLKESSKNKKAKVRKFIKKCNFLIKLNPKNRSQILDKISSCNVMPVLYLALLGNYVDKRDSFKIFKPKLHRDYHGYFSEVLQLWNTWPHKSKNYKLNKFIFIFINPLQFKFLMSHTKNSKDVVKYKDYFTKINLLVSEYKRMAEKLNG